MTRHGAALDRSAFAGFRFPPEVITVAVRLYRRYGLSYRNLEELLAQRGIEVDHVSVYRWVQRFTPLFVETPDRFDTLPATAGSSTRPTSRWPAGGLNRALDQFGQVIDVRLADHRDLWAARRFFTSALRTAPCPVEVTTDRAAAYPRVLDELLPAARHVLEQYANNPVECDHGRLKARLRPMRAPKRFRSAVTQPLGHAFVQNVRRGHYELGLDVPAGNQLAVAFTELAAVI